MLGPQHSYHKDGPSLTSEHREIDFSSFFICLGQWQHFGQVASHHKAFSSRPALGVVRTLGTFGFLRALIKLLNSGPTWKVKQQDHSDVFGRGSDR